MEEQVLALLNATTTPDTIVIRQAEQGLLGLYPQPAFPFTLLGLATAAPIPIGSRKAALTTLRKYITATWSPQFVETFSGQVYLGEDAKTEIRSQILAICTTLDGSNDGIHGLAAGIASKIASVDFPEQWPQVFPELIRVVNNASSDPPAQGALRVLLELVDSGLSEDQFFTIAQDLVNSLQHVTSSNTYSASVQAVAVCILSSCIQTLEQVMQTEKAPAVRTFLDESMKYWMEYFRQIIKQPLPDLPPEAAEGGDISGPWRGLVALKVQVVKALAMIKRVYAAPLTPHVLELFTAIWEELSRISPTYNQLFIEGESDSKLVDSDGLQYTLDALAIEDIEFLGSALKAKSVRTEFGNQMKQLPNAEHTVTWLQELLKVLVQYCRIAREEEELWQFDANVYLAEIISVTTSYTPRDAATGVISDVLTDWLHQAPVKALLHLLETTAATASSREREAILHILSQALRTLKHMSSELDQATTEAMLGHFTPYLQDENMFLRAAAHICLGDLFKVSSAQFNEAASQCLAVAIQSATQDKSDIVNMCCINVISIYLQDPPHDTNAALQGPIINAIQEYLNNHDLREDLDDATDVKSALIYTLRAAIILDTRDLSSGPAMDLFFTLASDGAPNFQLSEMLLDAFEFIVERVAEDGMESYVRLCAKTIPSLSGAFDVANMTHESDLTNLAAELVNVLASFGLQPLPDGFVAALMPKLQRVLMEGTEASLLRPATSAVAAMLERGTDQLSAWTDPTGKPSTQVCLEIVDRLLNSADVEEAAADQVGSLAANMVDKFGADGLGDYLMQLLRAVAVRLVPAERAGFIQSLLMVFAKLSVKHVQSVIDFLSQTDINGQNGLTVVVTKWLENSVLFAGFDEIRINVSALSNIYSLQDPRVKSITVKGDLIVENTGRIKTRSQAKLNPDRYTTIPADLKILKLLTDELHNAATSKFNNLGAANRAAQDALDDDDAEDDDGDGDWEDDDDGELDLNNEQVKAELMGWVGEGDAPAGPRIKDDETVEYLLTWFKAEASKDGFTDMFAQLSPDEQNHLHALVK